MNKNSVVSPQKDISMACRLATVLIFFVAFLFRAVAFRAQAVTKRQRGCDVAQLLWRGDRAIKSTSNNACHFLRNDHAKPRKRTWRFKGLRGGATVLATATSAHGVPSAPSAWLGIALLCALSYALYNLFIKKASAGIDPVLGGVLLQFVAAFLGSFVLVVKRFVGGNAVTTATKRAGVWWAVAAGVAVGMAEILSLVIGSMGVSSVESIPIIVGGSVVFGTLLGVFWLKEFLTVKGWCGVVLIAAGIALVGVDSGGALH